MSVLLVKIDNSKNKLLTVIVNNLFILTQIWIKILYKIKYVLNVMLNVDLVKAKMNV